MPPTEQCILGAENKTRINNLEMSIKEGFALSTVHDKEILEQLNILNKGLYKDNGSECLQSKLNKNTNRIGGIIAFMTAIGLTVLALLSRVVYGWISSR